MKINITALVLLSGSLLLPLASTQATTTSSSTESGNIFDVVVENVSELTDTVKEQLPGNSPAESVLSTRAQERITNLAANISNRFDGITARLWHIVGRLESRIAKLKQNGADTTAAETSLQAAIDALRASEARLSTIDKDVQAVVGSPTPKAAWQTVKDTFLAAREHIRIAHSELRTTITILKTIPEPSPTESTATTSDLSTP